MPPAYEVLLLNTAIPQIQAAQSGDTYVVPRDIAFSAALTLSAGTANGVPYLNGSKVVTTGSALTFDGTFFGTKALRVADGNNGVQYFGPTADYGFAGGVDNGGVRYNVPTGMSHQFRISTTQAMTLDASGNLLVGTTSASYSAAGRGVINLGGSASGLLGFQIGGVAKGYVAHFDSNMQIWNDANSPMLFATNATERARITSGGQFAMTNDGTNAAPAISFTNDLDTGIFRPTTNQLGFATAGVQAMTLDASGNLGLGSTSTPTGQAADNRVIQIYGAGTANRAQIHFCNSDTGETATDGSFIGIDVNKNLFIINRENADTVFENNGTEKARITSGGNFVVGDTSTSSRFEAVAGTGAQYIGTFRTGDATAANNAGGGFYGISSATAATREAILWLDADAGNFTGLDYFYIQKFGNSGVVNIVNYSNAAMTFYTNAAERARITSGGYFKASNNGTYTGSTSSYHESYNTASNYTHVFTNTNASPVGPLFLHSVDSNGTGNEFWYCQGNATQRAALRSNGGLANFQANDVNLSDQRTKKDIVAAPSYWNKIKGIEIVHFKYKDQTHDDNNVGVIAQQVEQVAPEFVDQDGWGETPEDGVPLKSIYTSDMYHAAIKALQEAMARIEQLEAKVAAFEAK